MRSAASKEIDLGLDFLDETRASAAEIAAHEARVEAEVERQRILIREIEELRAEAEARGEDPDETVLIDERYQFGLDRLIPDEDSVMLVAGRWSLDPTRLEDDAFGPSLGLVGSVRRRHS